MTLLRALDCLNPGNLSFQCVHTKKNTLCICFSFQSWSVFSTTTRMKNRPLIIIESKAHKKLNPSLATDSAILIFKDRNLAASN